MDDFVEVLTLHGIPYNKCILRPTGEPLPPVSHHASFIPIRSYGYKPDPGDFAAYFQRVRALLSDIRLARAALQKGGIMWRIAMEHVPPAWAFSHADANGITRYGRTYSDSSSNEVLWFEDVDLEMEDLICGLYRIERSPGLWNVTENISWFPTPSIWEKSGYNLGCWTTDAESWFRSRIEGYIRGDSIPRNQSEWRSALRATRDTSVLRDTMDSYADGALRVDVGVV